MSATRAKRSKSEPRDAIPDETSSAGNVVALSSARRAKNAKQLAEASEVGSSKVVSEGALDAVVDGKRVTIEADTEIVLRCGKSSITLTRSGKIILRGTHVVSRSSGANRVQGAQVRIN